METPYRTSLLYMVAWLLAHGETIRQATHQSRRVVFEFNPSPTMGQHADTFYQNATIGISDFLDAIRQAKDCLREALAQESPRVGPQAPHSFRSTTNTAGVE
jgi:hypothetical protein